MREAAGEAALIETSLIRRLRNVARDLASGEPCPRWVFLVGGPGNGKSEAVQDFLMSLEDELGANGALVGLLRQRFQPNPLVPWVVDIDSQANTDLPASFRDRIGRLIIVQDASASTQPRDDAASRLATFLDYLLDLLTSPPPVPVFVCCVNRGLLARALRTAHESEAESEVVELVRSLVRATALGSDALSEDRPSCWPLSVGLPTLNDVVACWPLDMESLLLPSGEATGERSPFERIFEVAVDADQWEIPGRCADCDDSSICPFHENARTLRQPEQRRALQTVLRRGELATGRRWNFRDTFSLAAELVVGEWSDFNVDHPCVWVHEEAEALRDAASQPSSATGAAYRLVSRLYGQALFSAAPVISLPGPTRDTAVQRGFELTLALGDSVGTGFQALPPHHVRIVLRNTIAPRLDPALLSPHDDQHPLARLEDAYSQSVGLGNESWPLDAQPGETERLFLQLVARAEQEWDAVNRESAQASDATRFLKRLASTVAKRSVGARLGFHADERYLNDYEQAIRDVEALDTLLDALQVLLGGDGFRFNALETFGQPWSEADWLVHLQGSRVPVEPITPAPGIGGTFPAHDLPAIRMLGYAVPLTYDLYAALRLREEGCTESSLPASVRAAIDRIRHRHAGGLCRDGPQFVNRSAEYIVRDRGRIVLPRLGQQPRFRKGG